MEKPEDQHDGVKEAKDYTFEYDIDRNPDSAFVSTARWSRARGRTRRTGMEKKPEDQAMATAKGVFMGLFAFFVLLPLGACMTCAVVGLALSGGGG